MFLRIDPRLLPKSEAQHEVQRIFELLTATSPPSLPRTALRAIRSRRVPRELRGGSGSARNQALPKGAPPSRAPARLSVPCRPASMALFIRVTLCISPFAATSYVLPAL